VGEVPGGTGPRDAITFPGERGIADGVDITLPTFSATGGQEPDVGEERQD
jgi:hypothetical protein